MSATPSALLVTRRRSSCCSTSIRIYLFRMLLAGAVLTGVTCAQRESAPKGKSAAYAELAKAPKKAVDRANPLDADPEAATAGAKLFDLHCAQCHGNEADGGRRGPSLRVSKVQTATPGALFWLLTNGVVRRGMPVWSKLPEPQRWQLVSFVKSLSSQKSTASTDKPPLSVSASPILRPSPPPLHPIPVLR
jgi:mono/diheme cytochrome c family protein